MLRAAQVVTAFDATATPIPKDMSCLREATMKCKPDHGVEGSVEEKAFPHNAIRQIPSTCLYRVGKHLMHTAGSIIQPDVCH